MISSDQIIVISNENRDGFMPGTMLYNNFQTTLTRPLHLPPYSQVCVHSTIMRKNNPTNDHAEISYYNGRFMIEIDEIPVIKTNLSTYSGGRLINYIGMMQSDGTSSDLCWVSLENTDTVIIGRMNPRLNHANGDSAIVGDAADDVTMTYVLKFRVDPEHLRRVEHNERMELTRALMLARSNEKKEDLMTVSDETVV